MTACHAPDGAAELIERIQPRRIAERMVVIRPSDLHPSRTPENNCGCRRHLRFHRNRKRPDQEIFHRPYRFWYVPSVICLNLMSTPKKLIPDCIVQIWPSYDGFARLCSSEKPTRVGFQHFLR